MPRSGPSLAVAVVAALTLPPPQIDTDDPCSDRRRRPRKQGGSVDSRSTSGDTSILS
jgi:hypothetical protein